jgi:hypothetical protein
MHEHPANAKEKDNHQLRIRRVLLIIPDNLTSELTLEKMACVLQIFPHFSFSKAFHQICGRISPHNTAAPAVERSATNWYFTQTNKRFLKYRCKRWVSRIDPFGRLFKAILYHTDEFRKSSNFDNSKNGTLIHKNSKEHDEHSTNFGRHTIVDRNETIGQTTGEGLSRVKLSSLKIAYIDSHLGMKMP